jgi:superfamily II DNA or RNA helicase
MGRIATGAGFLDWVLKKLETLGVQGNLIVKGVHNSLSLDPAWGRVEHMEFRPRQRMVLEAIANSECGIVDCNTGWGKTHIMMLLGMMHPTAKIIITTKRVDILKTIYNRLSAAIPGDVGIHGGGKKVLNRRIMCYGAGSLRHASDDADFLFADEVHELAADSYI